MKSRQRAIVEDVGAMGVQPHFLRVGLSRVCAKWALGVVWTTIFCMFVCLLILGSTV